MDTTDPSTRTSQDSGGQGESPPICSVLNLVVDHIMVAPTRFERSELELQKFDHDASGSNTGGMDRNSISVPVLRFFGPIIRRDLASTTETHVFPEPVQSACLYVHNAFPYLLARPIIAGPDGVGGRPMMFTTTDEDIFSNLSSQSPHVDWDSAAEVERIVPDITELLECAIQASWVQDIVSTSSVKGKQIGQGGKSRVIRRITVVEGRGFYSYCPGPPAPFLRVEYYDPSLRWKVKRTLERGLPNVPIRYLPDPAQYNSARFEASDDVLSFHCYEAHIPYTMQFFKDYNLAGMSYIHLGYPSESAEAQREFPIYFRDQLPHGPRKSKSPLVATKSETGDASAVQERFLFLDDNIPDSYRWAPSSTSIVVEQETVISSQLEITSPSSPTMLQFPLQQPSQSSSTTMDGYLDATCPPLPMGASIIQVPAPLLLPPPPRKETSCDVELDVSVENILNIHSIIRESPTNNDQKIHWRAVPSLRDMWQEERRRMQKLVPPQDDFLSSQQPPLTLHATQSGGQSGAALAVEGMRKLVHLTPGLEDQFRRVACDIVKRHKEQIDHMDAVMKRRAVLAEMQGVVNATPSHDEALAALGQLESAFLEDRTTTGTNPSQMAYSQTSSGSSVNLLPLHDLSPMIMSQSYRNSDWIDYDSEADAHEHELSQRMERGESVLVNGPFDSLDDFINPETLTPYENHDEGSHDDIDEDRFEIELSVLATQTFANRGEIQTPSIEETSRFCDIPFSTSLEHERSSLNGGINNLLSDETQVSPPLQHVVHVNKSDELAYISKNKTSAEVGKPKFDRTQVTNLSCAEPRGTLTDQPKPKASISPRQKTIVIYHTARLRRSPPTEGQVSSWYCRKLKRSLCMKGQDELNREECDDEGWRGSSDCGHDDIKCVASSGTRKIAKMECTVSDDSVLAAQTDGRRRKSMAEHKLVRVCEESTVPTTESSTPSQPNALSGLGNQGGKLLIDGQGDLKASTRPSQAHQCQSQTSGLTPYLPNPVSVMVVEVFTQCRTGQAGSSDARTIAMTPDPARDKVVAVTYVYGKDPGGGYPLQTQSRGCLFVPVDRELDKIKAENLREFHERMCASIRNSMPQKVIGIDSPLSVECLRDEKHLLLRFASIVRTTDPDMLLSWDTQGSGLGYLIERGRYLGRNRSGQSSGEGEIDLSRLLGRTPSVVTNGSIAMNIEADTEVADNLKGAHGSDEDKWKGSGLGPEWDERVGAGAAAASIVGRIVFASWKIIAEEVKHPNASYLPAIVSAVLGKRIPFHDNLRLAEWYGHNRGVDRWRVLHYKLVQATCSVLLLDALDIIGRSGEAARLSGVELMQSFPGIRGSQYKVEGVLLRALQSLNSDERGSKKGKRIKFSNSTPSRSLSNQETSQSQSPWKLRRGLDHEVLASNSSCSPSNRSYFFFSPSLQDTNRQEALEVQALTLEPVSGYHKDPVVVCDFTALYPSLAIAYNLCYSTCAGRLDYHSTRQEMRLEGRTTGTVGPMRYGEEKTASVLKHHMNSVDYSRASIDRTYVAPTGTLFVSESVLKGVLPQVLDEILSTRAMLKKAAKLYKRLVPDLSPSILRQLEARQLALKYVANVTYGYTSATFSGRCAMPLLADAIVECGRRTLTKAIHLANTWGQDPSGKWFGCEVIYGDTDSIFVKLKGRSVEEAFLFGQEFCQEVTSSNPPPVQLKLEKVYIGSMMQTKKKYCGMKSESKDQKNPVFESKGLETIRRDQCALTQRVLRNCLVRLFRNGIESVKEYVMHEWNEIISGNTPISDFILTGRVRSRYRGGRVGPVQAALAKRLAEADPGRTIRHKERLAYVIVATPGATFRLRDCVLTPLELMEQWDSYTIHSAYYIMKHLNAALQRCLGLPPYEVDVSSWYELCPKPRRRIHFWPVTRTGASIMISAYFGSDTCSLCRTKCVASGRSKTAVCTDCRSDEAKAAVAALSRLNQVQVHAKDIANQCMRCNLCYEDSSTFAACRTQKVPKKRNLVAMRSLDEGGIVTPLANCTCIDCPNTFRRHRLREAEIEAKSVCEALELPT